MVQSDIKEFIHIQILVSKPNYCKWSLNKYDIEKDEHTCCTVHSCKGFRAFYKVVYDPQEKQLYMHSVQNILHIFDIIKGECQHYQTLHAAQYLVFANKCLYDIDNYQQYAIYPITQPTLCHESQYPVGRDGALEGGVAIYIQSKSCIVLFGGYYAHEFGIKNDGYVPQLSNEIWCFSLPLKKWTRMTQEIEINRYDFEAVLCSNERYIITMGGYVYDDATDKEVESNDIYIIDMKDNENWKIAKCKINCPSAGICLGTSTGGLGIKNTDVLVYGYIKYCWQSEEMYDSLFPTTYIINMIANWYSAECIHWIRNDVGHFAFFLRNLLRVTKWV